MICRAGQSYGLGPAEARPAAKRPRRRVHRPRPPRGFTLVELLVVLGIITALVAVLLPALARARDDARRLQCLGNVRQIAMAFFLYTADNKGSFPASAAGPYPTNWDWIFWTGSPSRPLDDSALAQYLGRPVNPDILRCPSDDWSGHAAGLSYGWAPYLYSYTANEWLMPTPGSPAAAKPALRIVGVRNSAEKVLVVEEDERTIDDGNWAAHNGNWLAIRHDRQRKMPDAIPWAGWPIPNPDRRGNAGFVDGHGEYVTRKYAHDPLHYDPRK